MKDNNLYIGQRNDVNKRLILHSAGKVKSTSYGRPLRLIGFKSFKSRNFARWFEYQVKHHSDKKKKFIRELEAQLYKSETV